VCCTLKIGHCDLRLKWYWHFKKQYRINKHCMQVQPGIVQCRVPYLGHFDLLFTFHSKSKENLVWVIYIKYRFMHDHQTWYGILHIIVQLFYFIYQQTSSTVQYKINLKCMFKHILYPTLRSLQNQTLDGRIMYSPVFLLII